MCECLTKCAHRAFKSRVSIIILSILYLVAFGYLLYLTGTQWNSSSIARLPLVSADKKFQDALIALAGPLSIKGRSGRWGWPLGNSIFRVISFSLLGFCIVASWILRARNSFGFRWRLMLIFMVILLATTFRFEEQSISSFRFVIG